MDEARRKNADQNPLLGSAGLTGPDAIRRILLTTLWLAAILALVAWAYLGWRWALAFLGGTCIGGGNLIFLTALGRQFLRPGPRDIASLIGLLSMKMVAIYGGLIALLLWKEMPTVGVVCGFSLTLAVITLKAAGRAPLASGIIGAREPSDGIEHDRRER